MRTRRLAARLTLVASLSLLAGATVAPLAHADVTYCVHNAVYTCPPGSVYDGPNLQAALTAAEGAAGSNTVVIGPGTYTAAGSGPFSYAPGSPHPLTITGSGRAGTATSTTLNTTTPSTGGVLRVSNGPVNISDLAIAIVPTSSTTYGLVSTAAGTVGRVDVGDGASSPGAVIGVTLTPTATDNAALQQSTIALTGSRSTGIIVSSGTGTATVQDSSVTMAGAVTDPGGVATKAVVANGGFAIVQRSTVVGSDGLLAVGSFLTAEDDLITQIPGPTGGGAMPVLAALQAVDSGATHGTLVARHVTAYGNSPYLYSWGAYASSGGTGGATINLHNSILANFHNALQATNSGGGGAQIATDYSNYSQTGDTSSGGGITVTEPNHLSLDPAFLAPSTGSGGDFRLGSTSPMIDAGDPAPLLGSESATDLAGLPRVVHGRRDVGAYEYQALVASATQSTGTATAGTAVSFDGSASTDPNPGHGTLTYSWAFDDGASAAGAAVSHAWSTAGTHTATLTVGDGSPVTAQTVKTVSVTAPAAGPLPAPTIPPIVRRPTALSASLTVFSERLKRLRAHGLDVRARCSVGCRMTIELVIDASTARAVHLPTHAPAPHAKREAVIGRRTITLTSAPRRIAIRLTAKARKKLRRRSRLTITVRATARPLTGGPTVTTRKRITLRR